jgi:hypothetical protein
MPNNSVPYAQSWRPRLEDPTNDFVQWEARVPSLRNGSWLAVEVRRVRAADPATEELHDHLTFT